MLKPVHYRLGTLHQTDLCRVLSRASELAGVVWIFFQIFLRRLFAGMSARERNNFILRIFIVALALNYVYLAASYGFYYGHLPGWLNLRIAQLIIGPFRSIFAFAPIGRAVTIGLGAPSSGPTMITPLLGVRSPLQYTIVMIVVSLLLAIVTDQALWGRQLYKRSHTSDYMMYRLRREPFKASLKPESAAKTNSARVGTEVKVKRSLDQALLLSATSRD